jgi:septal ring factor EnvC (AmiA/AmiB activator)
MGRAGESKMIRIVEAIQGYLRHLNESLAECASAMTETAKNLEMLSNSTAAMTHKLGELFDQQAEQNERLNRYLSDQAQKERAVLRLQSEVAGLRSEVREKLSKVASG